MRTADIYVHGQKAAKLVETNSNKFEIKYLDDYEGASVSLTLPVNKKVFTFNHFPAFFEGLLPEGHQLEALLKQKKIDDKDYFSQLMAVGEDLVGAVTVLEVKS